MHLLLMMLQCSYFAFEGLLDIQRLRIEAHIHARHLALPCQAPTAFGGYAHVFRTDHKDARHRHARVRATRVLGIRYQGTTVRNDGPAAACSSEVGSSSDVSSSSNISSNSDVSRTIDVSRTGDVSRTRSHSSLGTASASQRCIDYTHTCDCWQKEEGTCSKRETEKVQWHAYLQVPSPR